MDHTGNDANRCSRNQGSDTGTSDYDYKTHNEDSEWRQIAEFAMGRPLLGFYDDSLPEVNDWHINWALEAGISWFAFDWYWNAGEKRLERSLEQGFLNARYNEMMEFCIHWCNHGLDWKAPLDFSCEALEEMIRYCVEHYFQRPNYMRINDRPVFMIWDIKAVMEQNGGAAGFRANVLTDKVLAQAQGLLSQGASRREVAEELGVLSDTIRKAINQGRLCEPDSTGVTTPPQSASDKSDRSLADASAEMGNACTRPEERVLASLGILIVRDTAPRFSKRCGGRTASAASRITNSPKQHGMNPSSCRRK